ncbi:MAG: transrane protein [Acidobacteria bacterium]|nr:transrane protein [Acidobacteriota bacterium]
MTAVVERTKTSGRLRFWAWRILTSPFVILAAIVILIEDWLWQDLARLAAAIGRLPILRSVEAFIVSLPPYPALLFFATPALLLLPLKLVALYFVSHGQATLGVLTIIAAKFAGTAVVARIFTLTRSQLLRIGWFAWLYQRFLAFKNHIYGTLKSTAIYRIVHELHLRMREALRVWWSKRRSRRAGY